MKTHRVDFIKLLNDYYFVIDKNYPIDLTNLFKRRYILGFLKNQKCNSRCCPNISPDSRILLQNSILSTFWETPFPKKKKN